MVWLIKQKQDKKNRKLEFEKIIFKDSKCKNSPIEIKDIVDNFLVQKVEISEKK